MAEITNQSLKTEALDQFITNVNLHFEVNFTQREVRENIAFGIFVLLMERDEDFERFHQCKNGVFSFSFSPFNFHQTGNQIHWMANKTLQPNGSSHTTIELSTELIAQNLSDIHNNYRVYIFVMPEVLCGRAWTDDVCINYQ